MIFSPVNTNIKNNGLFLYIFSLLLIVGCQSSNQIPISGIIDYVGSSEIYFAKQPIHYKYADKIEFPVKADGNGEFSLTIPVDSTQLIDLFIDDQSYPIVARPGNKLSLNIPRASFPDSIYVEGYSDNWNQRYIDYLDEIAPVEKEIDQQLTDFTDGEKTDIPSLYKKRYQLAQKYFQDTPLEPLYHKKVGEYLVKRLEEITYRRNQPEFDAQNVRREIVEEAQNLNFFTFESLHAQRAGIRDFTNAFANTFGVADSLDRQYGQELMQYDVKRLGYDKLDSVRTSVLKYIDQRRAKAYAKMYLIAERIGEMPLKIAEPSYQAFLENYSDFPRYTSFLKSFHEKIKRVSPGHPAVAFSLPNATGDTVQLKDYRGKYVLLDFWASWCIPCLDEFPHMKDLYETYSRDQFEILGISIEKDSLRWRRSIQRFENPWPQLYAGNGFEQRMFKTYGGGGIPFYILVDPEGNILRYNDVRPSFNLPSVLDSLINEET